MYYAEVVIEASVNVVRRDEAFWLTESDWCFKKVFHTIFDVLVTWSFCLYQCLLLKERKTLYSSVTIGNFFSQAAIIFATYVCELVHRKTFVFPTDCCFWKKDLKTKAERRRNHWRQKRVVFQKTFWTGNSEGIV